MKNGYHNSIPSEVLAEMEAAVATAMNGRRTKKAMQEAAARMDKIGEEVRKKHGVLNIGVPAIRGLRDGK